MIGAGIFASCGPATAAAGSGVPVALAVAAVVAYRNATSSARLAVRYPESGGSYVYARQRLGVALPAEVVLPGLAVVAVGIIGYVVRRQFPSPPP